MYSHTAINDALTGIKDFDNTKFDLFLKLFSNEASNGSIFSNFFGLKMLLHRMTF